jgi:hypothetical protein
MVCPRCQQVVPEESAFCLACGARLAPAERPEPVNGRGAPGPAPAASAVAAGVPAAAAGSAESPAGPGGRQAYALSFRPIVDERVRYRLARWVCERAPAHELPDVQSGLSRGDFVTFLALTTDEAERARQGLQALGVAAGLVNLVPATLTESLMLERPARGGGGKRTMSGKDWVTTLAIAGALLGFGFVLMRLFGGGPF